MKTAEEWIVILVSARRMIGVVRDIQRDAWEAATKAQMIRDNDEIAYPFTEPVPFPSEAQ